VFSKQREWKVLAYVAISLATASLVLTSVVLPESPRFLLGKKRYAETEQVLRKIQQVNNKGTTLVNLADEMKVELATLKEVFQSPTSRTNLIIMVVIWSFGSFAFFLVPFYLQEVKADIY
jgi:hypothetical protein